MSPSAPTDLEIPPELLHRHVRKLRVFLLPLLMGVGGFLLIIVLLRRGDWNWTSIPPAALMISGFALLQLIAALLLPRLLTQLSRQQISRNRSAANPSASNPSAATPEPDPLACQTLLNAHSVRTICRNALLEGAAFLAGIAALVSHSPWPLLILLVAFVLLQVPPVTVQSVTQWIEHERELRSRRD